MQQSGRLDGATQITEQIRSVKLDIKENRRGKDLAVRLFSITLALLAVVLGGCTDIRRQEDLPNENGQSKDGVTEENNNLSSHTDTSSDNKSSSGSTTRVGIPKDANDSERVMIDKDGGLNDSPELTSCITGAIRCSNRGGPQRERCEDDQWIAAEPCTDGEVCDINNTSEPGTCIKTSDLCRGSAGMSVCDGAIMHRCSESAVPLEQEECASERHCIIGLNNGACAICLPGEYRCNGAVLEQCASNGSGFLFDEVCPSEAFCSASAGACTDATCLKGRWNCDGDMLQQCNQEQTAFEDFEPCDPGMCDKEGGQCYVCTPGNFVCEGNTVVSCDASGQDENRQKCPQDTPYCIGKGKCVECETDSDCIESDPDPCKEYYCSVDSTCKTENLQEGDSCGTSSVPMMCDEKGDCVVCRNDDDCGLGQVCNSSHDSCDQIAMACSNGYCPAGGTCKSGICFIPCYSDDFCVVDSGWNAICYYNEDDGWDWGMSTSICLLECGANGACPKGFVCTTKIDNGETGGQTNAHQTVRVCLLASGW